MTKDTEHYEPINCDLHSQYELAIMHHTKLRLVWHEPGGQDHVCTVLPLDLTTEHGEEFLVARDHTGQQIRIRLDRIHSARTADHD